MVDSPGDNLLADFSRVVDAVRSEGAEILRTKPDFSLEAGSQRLPQGANNFLCSAKGDMERLIGRPSPSPGCPALWAGSFTDKWAACDPSEDISS